MIGIDIEEVERFKSLDSHLIERVYTKNEIEYCNSMSKPHVHFAGMWCCKEAVVKALSDLHLAVSEIEILHENSGKPYINITDKIKQYLNKFEMNEIYISISHTNKVATAIAMLR